MSATVVLEAMRTCRTVRRLRPDPIPDDVLRTVLTAATWAPSGGNRQPWRFVVIRDPERRRRLQELYEPLWKRFAVAYGVRMRERFPESAAQIDVMMRAAEHLAEHLHEAPVIVVVCVHLPDVAITDAALDRPSVVAGASIYPAVQNLLLACHAVGLGAALTTLLCQQEPEVRALLGIPKAWATCAHVPIGYPRAKAHRPVVRQPVAEVAFLDTWDRALFPAD